MESRFGCTSCGRCCYGWLPLTLEDALTHAARFPLALVWQVVPQGVRNYPLAAKLGVQPKSRKRMAVLIMPVAYIPPAFPCTQLQDDGLCRIHEHKPARCRTMPFYPYREESDQSDMIRPRKGWQCDVSATAPVVYKNKRIVDREDFDIERGQLLAQANVMRQYADYMFKYSPWIIDSLATLKPDGSLITSLSSFLTAIKHLDAKRIASEQLPLFQDFAARTATLPELLEYHRNYAGWAKEMDYLAKAPDRLIS